MLNQEGKFDVPEAEAPALVPVIQSLFPGYLQVYKDELISILQRIPFQDPTQLQLTTISLRARIELVEEIQTVFSKVEELTTNPTSTEPTSKGQAA